MEQKKEYYEKPEMDVVELENDVIWTTSGGNEGVDCTVYAVPCDAFNTGNSTVG